MKLTNTEVTQRVSTLPGWRFENDALRMAYTFPSFSDAVAFVVRLAFAAEAADHHPDLQVSYKKVAVTWSTHSDGGVTEKDFDGARQSDKIARTLEAQDQL